MSEKAPERHLETVESEFTRQADAFAGSAVLNAADITETIAEALGDEHHHRVLDVACGPGILTPVLSPKADWVVGLDFTDKPLRLARDRSREAHVSNAAFLRGTAERTPLGAGVFDAAILRLALHHFERPETVLKEVRRLLRPGGRLVVLDILTSSDPHRAMLHNAIERLRDPSHTVFSPAGDLVEMIAGAGFEITTQRIWQTPRSFDSWAEIIADPARMDALEVVLRELARSGADADIALREQDGELWFTYGWGLFVATAR